jgi:hypothetical protein
LQEWPQSLRVYCQQEPGREHRSDGEAAKTELKPTLRA